MALDGIVVRAIVHELQVLVGGRMNKIHQPNSHDIVVSLRAGRENTKLLISASPTYPRVQFTKQTFVNPTEAPMFCMLLRKHCESAIIEKISQVGMERIIHIDVRQRDELGDISTKKIIIELMGRHSNIILVDPSTGNILDGIHHVTPAISSYRVIMPGFSYTEPPQQNKENPLTAEASSFSTYESYEGTAVKWLVESFSGLSPLTAEEIASRGGQADPEASRDKEQLWKGFTEVINLVSANEFTPVIATNAKEKMVFSAIPLTHLDENKTYDSISACMEAYYGEKAERDAVKQKVSDLLRFLQNERNKNIKKLDHLNADLAEADDADQYRIFGELLFASLHAIQKGDKEAVLTNFYDEDQAEVRIPLDPLLTPSDNAQRYFKNIINIKTAFKSFKNNCSRHEMKFCTWTIYCNSWLPLP